MKFRPKWVGAQIKWPIGDLGMEVVLSAPQMADLVNHIRTGQPFQNRLSRYPAAFLLNFVGKDEILKFYKEHRPKVKRTKKNSGKLLNLKRKQPYYITK